MSLPSVRRTVAVMPCDCKMLWKRAMASRELVWSPVSSTSLSGIMFTCAPMPESFFAKSSACSGLSLTPEIIVYSKDTRRPVIS